MGKSLRVGTVIPVKLLNIPLVSFSLINFVFLLLHTVHFDKSIILPFFVFMTFGFFLNFKQYDNIVFIYTSNFYLLLEFLISSFISSYSLNALFIKTNSW